MLLKYFFNKKGKQEEWTVVFIITIVVYLIGAVGFLFLGKADTEQYASDKKSNNLSENEVAEENFPLKEK